MTSAYAIRSPIQLTSASFGLSFLRDALPKERKQSIDFHIASGDYFGTLATVIGLMADSLSSDAAGAAKRCVKTMADLQEDLQYLHETHTIQRN